jgi:adenylate cyclase
VSRSSIFAASSERNRPILASVSVFRLMRIYRLYSRKAIEGARRLERPVRLTTALILFAFATSHLVNHALGIRSIELMQAASAILLAPWQTDAGVILLYTSFLVHGSLGFYALYRRRHLRLPASEAWQLALGLAIPLLLISHAGAIRLGEFQYGRAFGYGPVLYKLWVTSPDIWLPRQLILLLIAWIHGCIGLRAWLRTKRWYHRATGVLSSLATLVPVLAILGVVNAGLNLRDAALRDPAYAASLAPSPGSQEAQYAASAGRIADGITILYLGLVMGTFGLRAARNWHAKRIRGVRITYPGDRVVSVPSGFSVLEASRWMGLPHASVCGGRGRCSTCKVRVVQGAQWLEAPGPVERSTLRRIGAPPLVRLACQLRPSADVSVEPLVSARIGSASGAARFDAAIAGGRELQIAAMFVDLRESTRLATGRLPYDALFLFDRYIQAVTGAIRRNRGYATSIAGDGVMSVFGVDGTAELAARSAFQAALDVWRGLEILSADLAGELQAPLRIGIGIHVGMAVVGLISVSEAQSLQFLGDTGNVAAKLEAQSKELACTLVASVAALKMVAPGATHIETSIVAIAGKIDPVEVAVFRNKSELEQILSSPGSP